MMLNAMKKEIGKESMRNIINEMQEERDRGGLESVICAVLKTYIKMDSIILKEIIEEK